MTTDLDAAIAADVAAADRDRIPHPAAARRSDAGRLRPSRALTDMAALAETELCDHCRAVAGSPCVNPRTSEPAPMPHARRTGKARRRAADLAAQETHA